MIATDTLKVGEGTPITFTQTGDLTAPAGDFKVSMLGTGSDYVDRVWLTMGFAGEQVFNDLSDEAVESIVVKTNPKKTSYTVGQTLDTTGLSIYELMNTGRTRDVESGWTVESVTFDTAGIQRIPVSYNGMTTTFTVVVHEIVPESLEIITPAEKTSFYVGEALDTSGLELKLTYNNGDVESVTSGYTASIDKFTQAGLTTVSITYAEFTVTYEVDVTTPSLLSLSITTLPTKTEYTAGEMFSTAGMVVTGNYSAGITSEITDYTYTPNGALTVGITEIVIEKNGYTATCPITVIAPVDEVEFVVAANDVVAVPGANFNVMFNVDAGATTSFESLEYVIYYDTRLTLVSNEFASLPEGWEVWDLIDGTNGVIKVAVIDENAVPVPATAEQLAYSLTFSVPDTVANGEILKFTVAEVLASDNTFSSVDGVGGEYEVLADTKITLAAGSDYVIDRANGLVYISHENTTVAEFYTNFACAVTVSSSSIVGTGATVKLELDGVAVDTLTVVLIGDVNRNGRIESNDYNTIQKGVLGTTNIPSPRSIAADVNGNGYIDTSDYMLVRKHIEGVINIHE